MKKCYTFVLLLFILGCTNKSSNPVNTTIGKKVEIIEKCYDSTSKLVEIYYSYYDGLPYGFIRTMPQYGKVYKSEYSIVLLFDFWRQDKFGALLSMKDEKVDTLGNIINVDSILCSYNSIGYIKDFSEIHYLKSHSTNFIYNFEYDKNNNITKMVSYQDGIFYYSQQYEYNNHGYVQKSSDSSNQTDMNKYYIFEYNSDDYVINIKKYDSTSTIWVALETFTYNSNKITKHERITYPDNLNETDEFDYNGDLLIQYNFNISDNPIGYKVYTYNDNGLIIEINYYQNGKFVSKHKLEYNYFN
ncbi:MAG: hypothetical protein ABSG15_01985 [FCB group bacterium]|jgi:hypothetical protein